MIKDVEEDLTYFEEQMLLYKDINGDLNAEKQARLKIM